MTPFFFLSKEESPADLEVFRPFDPGFTEEGASFFRVEVGVPTDLLETFEDLDVGVPTNFFFTAFFATRCHLQKLGKNSKTDNSTQLTRLHPSPQKKPILGRGFLLSDRVGVA
ncbi:hypothetical protein LEP1GSC060_3344 [Leptospira weilii serovar Ranarum str. ICFT]|uniref:Uncharacterized protein n=1 Tax=Leptospira weilii serovar Ranarum str. ICFT TaxID=1218598 RepID=N1W9R7_9LEPT|nr:hypothetical protein LEP1GSC060_3344 [Leptospira weilii serovar Ranarum str. ICFT]